MRFLNIPNILLNAAQVKLGVKRLPLFVSWSITHRCNAACGYCGRWDMKDPELDTTTVLKTIDALYTLGTRVISFGGGEPLLRDDIGVIIRYCQRKGIEAGIISNGYLVGKKIDHLRGINVVKLSFDGPEPVHDRIRGKGSFGHIMEAVSLLKKSGIKVVFNTTLSKFNCDAVDDIVQKTEELGLTVKFQPINQVVAADKPLDAFLPEKNAYQQAIQRIMDLKKTSPVIINSLQSLRYLSRWPERTEIACYAGKVLCHITPNGEMYPCTMMEGKTKAYNCVHTGVKKAFFGMPNVRCGECWCTSTLELNQLMSLRLNPLVNIIGFSKGFLESKPAS